MSRLTLGWFNLTQAEGQDLCLKIPICDVYHPIIDRAFPDMDRIPWQTGTKGTCYTYIKKISDEDLERLNGFLQTLQSVRCITITGHLAPFFGAELDEAYALDFNFQQDTYPLTYTETGSIEHEAKEKRNENAIQELGVRLADFIRSHPTLSKADVIAAVPARPSSKFHLPEALVAQIGKNLGRETGLALRKDEHEKLRHVPMDQKVPMLKNVFNLDDPNLNGKTVLLIDDLYQSGATAWSLAKYLKEKGASEVYGLACVKSWSDTDNV